MGLKSGSRDAGLDESEDHVEQRDEQGTTEVERSSEEGGPSAAESTRPAESVEAATDDETRSQRPAMNSIPYKLRRAKVNEGREQVPYFLRKEIVDAESDLQDTLEELLDESVYKSDYREAAMVVAQRNPELVAEVLREWGYDLDAV
jgi:flagellar biosynthesis/type III secretory pathway M-ring protein FliF/YscJ